MEERELLKQRGFFCEGFSSDKEFNSLKVTSVIVIIMYALTFLLGMRNIWSVLIRQRYYKSVFLCLQYVSGQWICVLRVVATSLYIVGATQLRLNGFCEFTDFKTFKHRQQLYDIFEYFRVGVELTFWSMAFKSVLGIITLGMLTALYFKIRIIFNRSGSD
jgi:hypothetical protein